MSIIGKMLLALGLLSLSMNAALASKGTSSGTAQYSDPRGAGRQEMLMDLSIHYVRDTKPDGGTDSAARFSLGGMFTDYLGLDAQGLFEIRNKNYLIGGDLRFVPIDWFFLKAGVGAYAQKESHALSFTPLAGAGLMARFARDYYFLAESSYFTVNDRNNISFGVGLGMSF